LPPSSLLFSSGVADPAYRIAPIFLIRLAGVSFDVLEKLATKETAQTARTRIAAEDEFARMRSTVEERLASREHNLSKDQFRTWRKAVRSRVMPSVADPPTGIFVKCWRSGLVFANACRSLTDALHQELELARRTLYKSVAEFLPRYLVFSGSSSRELADLMIGCVRSRNKAWRARERHLLLYLQRICGKNDTLSEFGPHSWGSVDPALKTLELVPTCTVTERDVFVERWAAHGAVAALNRDIVIREDVPPRLHPRLRFDCDRLVDAETGTVIALDAEPEILNLLWRCDGTTPAYMLGTSRATLEKLAQENLIRWEMEVPALEPHAFDILLEDVAAWRNTPVRARWLEKLRSIAKLPKEFAQNTEPQARLSIVHEATKRLEELGARKDATRFLYSASNPIGEECFDDTRFVIGEGLINEVALEAAPWIDFWRDSYAFVASRVAAGLRSLLETAPLRDGTLPLPAFIRHCAALNMPLTGQGLIALAHLAFQEVKAAFCETLSDRTAQPEYQLTQEDCHFVRRTFSYEKFDGFTYPSADLQLAAESVEAVTRGQYQWILAELHPAVALLHHGFYWSCPDKAALSDALRQTLCGLPNLHFGYFATDFTATTTVRFDALADVTKFVSPQRAMSKWQSFPPAEAEVFIDSDTGDVGVRTRQTREYLGSFARGWVIPLGFHPFSFSLGQHTPRLLCGKVVVQRRSWTVTLQELGKGDFTGISRDLVVAIERLRAARDLPRHVFIRPTEQALRRAGVEGRDKDTKPVFVDLESYLFLEIFHRWLNKAGELEVTEMLPRPDQLLWQQSDGRHTFELRTLIVPR
jgi:hypothetical protein